MKRASAASPPAAASQASHAEPVNPGMMFAYPSPSNADRHSFSTAVYADDSHWAATEHFNKENGHANTDSTVVDHTASTRTASPADTPRKSAGLYASAATTHEAALPLRTLTVPTHRARSALDFKSTEMSKYGKLLKANGHQVSTVDPASILITQQEQQIQHAIAIYGRNHLPSVTGQTMFSYYDASHYRPRLATQYFHRPPPATTRGLEPMCAFVACYNEEADELAKTLRTLARQQEDCVRLGYDLHVLLVVDGWGVASLSAKKYISQMYPNAAAQASAGAADKPSSCWQQRMKTSGASTSESATFVLESIAPTTGEIVPVNIALDGDKPTTMKMTVLLKRDNRKKYNSHEWSFAFCRVYQPKYCFMGDTGSQLSHGCMYTLLQHMQLNDKCTAVAARMRIAPLSDEEYKGASWRQRWYHSVQSFEYELADNVFTACFALARHLLVIPGAGGIYRWSAIQEQCTQYYGDACNVDMWAVQTNTGEANNNPMHGFGPLLIGSLILAEDRLLAHGAVTRASIPGAYSTYCSNTFIYMDAETDYEKLLTQRRRWQNGTMAGLLYVLANWREIYHLREGQDRWRQALFMLLTFAQLVVFASTVMAPTYFVFGTRLSIKALVELAPALGFAEENLTYYQMISLFLFLGIFGVFLLVHLFDTSRKVFRWSLDLATLYGVVMVLLLASSIVLQLVHTGITLAFGACLLVTAVPFLLALVQSPESLWIMVKNFVPFFLFGPTYVVYLTYYSLSRVWELTWGNRPSTMETPAADGKQVASKSDASAADKLSTSVLLHVMDPAQEEKQEQARRNRIKTDLIDDSRTICFVLLLLNATILLGVQSYDAQYTTILVLMGCAFGGVLFHYVVALFYVLSNFVGTVFGSDRTVTRVLEPVKQYQPQHAMLAPLHLQHVPTKQQLVHRDMDGSSHWV